MARNRRHVFSFGLHSHLFKMALTAYKSSVTRAHIHDTNGRVKYNDAYAKIKAADQKYCPEFEMQPEKVVNYLPSEMFCTKFG